jgi:diguanylate cyclase (GGDEF)-like protein
MRPTAKKSRAKAPKKIKRRRGKPSHKTPGRGRTEPKLSTDRRLAALQLERETLKHGLTEAKTRIAELERQVDEDPLMPVANRRAFLRELTRLIGFAERYGVAGSIVYVDLNNLKAINDAHGHAAGDAALMQVARLLVENVRAGDVVGRLGGDELGVLLVQADKESAERKAALLAQRVESRPLSWRGRDLSLAITYGVHAFGGAENAEHAIAAADRAMYKRKAREPVRR